MTQANSITSHPIPASTVALTEDFFPKDSVYQFIGDMLFDQFRDE